MTVVARLTKLPKGHGLTTRLLDGVYDKLASDADTDDIVVVGIVRPVGHGNESGKRHVTLEPIRFEPVLDPDEASRLRLSIADAYEARTSTGTIPLDFDARSDDEQRQFLIDTINEWAAQEQMEPGVLRETFQDYLGGPEFAPSDLTKASALQLREFALAKGALAEDEPSDDDADAES